MPIEIFNLFVSAKVRESTKPEQAQQQPNPGFHSPQQNQAEAIMEQIRDAMKRQNER